MNAVLLDSLIERAESLLEQRECAAALQTFNEAEKQGGDPDRCSAGRWCAAMLLGDFGAAWRESDAIWARAKFDPHRFWNGEDWRGKRVMLRCLHGFGDAVQMLRYLPRLGHECRHVTLEVDPRLVDLACCFEGVDEVIPWGSSASSLAPEWDLQMEVMELPYLFRTHVEELPLATRYLHLPDDLQSSTGRRMGARSRPRVGLVWRAGEWDESRSLPVASMRRIAQQQGCEFWNLQHEADRERESISRSLDCRSATECGEGIAVLAAVIGALDLVITVDTLAAHLAGALGTPAWVMLQHAADWRWRSEGERSPWYPSLRLYRQPSPKDWATVVDQVSLDLKSWLQQHSRADRQA